MKGMYGTASIVQPGIDCDSDLMDNIQNNFVDERSDYYRGNKTSIIAPGGDIQSFELSRSTQGKPLTLQQQREKRVNENGNKTYGKGEVLTTDKAIEFMIHERQKMDEAQAALKKENEKLRDALRQQQLRNQSSVLLQPVSSSSSDGYSSDSNVLKWMKEIEQVQAENQRLRLQFLENEQTIISSSSSKNNIPISPSDIVATRNIHTKPPIQEFQRPLLVQRGPLFKQPNISVNQMGGAMAVASTHIEPTLEVPIILWDGGFLWKIPYNGKGLPERRAVMLKKSNTLNAASIEVHVSPRNSDSRNQTYIAYPPTLIWFHGDRAGELGRELVLFEDTQVVSGHSTPAFWKLANRNGQLPRHELCFSLLTSSRSLDVAAETASDAVMWKDALHTFLGGIYSQNGNRKHGLLQPPPPPNSNPPPPPLPPHYPPPSHVDNNVISSQFKQEILLKQMFAAVHAGDNEQLEAVLQAGVNVNQMEPESSDTPLMVAMRGGNTRAVSICLSYSARNDPHPEFGQTALHAGVEMDRFDCCSVLLTAASESNAAGIICNLSDPEGRTPLHLAALRGNIDMVELLLNHGADISRVDNIGQTMLHVCCKGTSNNSNACLALLLDHGGDVLLEEADRDGDTALHLAAGAGKLTWVKLLLETAAQVMACNKKGQTPYVLANLRGHHNVCMLLLEYQDHYSKANSTPVKQSQSSHRNVSNDTHNQTFSPLPTPVGNNRGFSTSPYLQQEQSSRHDSQSDTPIMRRSISETSNSGLILPRPHTTNSPNSTAKAAVAGLGSMPNSPTMPLSARASSNTGATAKELYAPISARERGSTGLFDGMQVSKQHLYKQQQGSELLDVVTKKEQGIFSSHGSLTISIPSPGSVPSAVYAGSSHAAPFDSYGKSIYMSSGTVDIPDIYNDSSTAPGDDKNQYDDRPCLNDGYEESIEYSDPVEHFVHVSVEWMSYYTEDGYLYYLDIATNHSQWEDPRVYGYLQSESSQQKLLPPCSPTLKSSSIASPKSSSGENRAFFPGHAIAPLAGGTGAEEMELTDVSNAVRKIRFDDSDFATTGAESKHSMEEDEEDIRDAVFLNESINSSDDDDMPIVVTIRSKLRSTYVCKPPTDRDLINGDLLLSDYKGESPSNARCKDESPSDARYKDESPSDAQVVRGWQQGL